MLRSLLCATFVMFAAVPAAAQTTVAGFLDRANPIRDQGVLGMLSPEVPALRAEARSAVARMKADNAARRAARKPPLYCKDADEPDPAVEEVVDRLNDIPQAQARRMPLKDGIARVMAQLFPCR